MELDRIKVGMVLGAALLLPLLAGPAAAQQTPGGSIGNGRDPSDRTDDGGQSEGPQTVPAISGSDTTDYNTAVDDYNHKKYKDAEAAMKDYLKKNGKDAQGYRLMADIYAAQNDVADAIPNWEAASRLDKNDKTSQLNLSSAYMQTGAYEKAIPLYRTELEHSPKDPQIALQLGAALDQAGHHAEAVAAFENAATLAPKDSAPLLYAGILNHQLGHDDKAVPELTKALALGTTQKFQVYLALAEAASAAKQTDEAIKDTALAAQANPDDFPTQANLGVLEQNAGKKADAEAAYRRAVTLKADDPKAMAGIQSNLALLLFDDGNLDEAANFMAQAVQNDPTNALFENNLGLIYEKQNKKDLAIAAYTKAVALDPGLAGAKSSLAQLQK